MIAWIGLAMASIHVLVPEPFGAAWQVPDEAPRQPGFQATASWEAHGRRVRLRTRDGAVLADAPRPPGVLIGRGLSGRAVLVSRASGEEIWWIPDFNVVTPGLVRLPPDEDADGDGVSNRVEIVRAGSSPTAVDTDGDGLSDRRELILGLNPTLADTDLDGLDDGWERAAGLDPARPDTDGDALGDGAELDAGTDPTAQDTDSDGWSDGEEIAAQLDPRRADTDGDGLDDGAERDLGTDPAAVDPDGDGLADPEELGFGADPWLPDTDGDGLDDGDEVAWGTALLDGDTDSDGARDGVEVQRGLDALAPDTDGDGVPDGDDPWALGEHPPVPFAVGDVVVSDPASSLPDPEFSADYAQIAWQELDGSALWIAAVDGATGAIVPPDGRGTFVTDGVAPIAESKNGPEWVHDARGPMLAWSRVTGPSTALWYSLLENGLWTSAMMPGRTAGTSPLGFVDPADGVGRVTFMRGSFGDPQSGYREVFRPDSMVLLPAALWTPDTRFAVDATPWIVGTSFWDGQRMPFVYDVTSALATRLPDSAASWDAFGWFAPDFGGRALVVARGDALEQYTELAVWVEGLSWWERRFRIPTPPGNPYVISAEPFVWGGRSWISFVASARPANFAGSYGQIWIASADGEIVRRVSDTALAERRDPEPYLGGDRPWVYYTEMQGETRILHRCETGLAP